MLECVGIWFCKRILKRLFLFCLPQSWAAVSNPRSIVLRKEGIQWKGKFLGLMFRFNLTGPLEWQRPPVALFSMGSHVIFNCSFLEQTCLLFWSYITDVVPFFFPRSLVWNPKMTTECPPLTCTHVGCGLVTCLHTRGGKEDYPNDAQVCGISNSTDATIIYWRVSWWWEAGKGEVGRGDFHWGYAKIELLEIAGVQ